MQGPVDNESATTTPTTTETTASPPSPTEPIEDDEEKEEAIWDWSRLVPDMEAIPGDPDAKVRLEVDGGVAAVRMVFEEPFSITRWQSGCIGCELSLTLLFSADLSAPQDCDRVANDVDYLYDLVGSPSRIDFSRERPPGEYVMLLASPGLAITNWGLGAADQKVEPTLVNVSATSRIVEPEKIDETGPAPYTATFNTVATVERPAMVLTAFMAEAGWGAGYEEGTSA